MKEALVLADGGSPSYGASTEGTPLKLTSFGRAPNVRLQIDVFRTRFLRELPERYDDLLRLAAFVYAADTRVSRGTERDVFGTQWSRRLRMVLPVWDLDFWASAPVRELLTDTLNFLTGDQFLFEFTRRVTGRPQQGILQFKDLLDPLPRVDVVVLFSGGTDSLASALEATGQGRHPILVSHRPAPVIDSRQRNLVDLLRQRLPAWSFPHISMWVNRAHDKRTIEFSQRSRSFLFSSLGVVTAALLELDEVRLCDNGIVSINLPHSSQNVGTLLSRSTHPRFISCMQSLGRLVTDRRHLNIHNTLLFKTKREVLEVIAGSGHPELLQEAVSCAHFEGKTKHQPHCGVCTQCIDRRFASVAAGLADHDLVVRYEKDIFVDPLGEGAQRTRAENYVRLAQRLEGIPSGDGFFASFPELYDILPAGEDADQLGRALWDLFRRHQQTVNGVLERQIQDRAHEIRRGTLPATCLLRIVATGQHTIDPRIRYVDRLRSLICRSLPAFFQTQRAKNERHVQDAGDSVFQAAKETLEREAPQIPFGIVTTKPDFASIQDNACPLFLEFKYPKDRRRLNRIITEMTSRVTVYSDQGAWVLFIVYDPKRVIRDDERFSEAFARHEGVWVGIAR